MSRLRTHILGNLVPIVFFVTTITVIFLADLRLNSVSNDVLSRVFRNLVLILALVIPVIAGLGLNFSIVLGAMAGQFGLMVAENLEVRGAGGILLAMGCALPAAILLGFLTGLLFNRCKGREMITGIILSFFAMGVYQFLFLLLAGPTIPLRNPDLLLPQGRGIRVTINLEHVGGGVDTPLRHLAEDSALRRMLEKEVEGRDGKPTRKLAFDGAVRLRTEDDRGRKVYWGMIPIFTLLVIAALMGAVLFLLKTKLGQDLRAVGQDAHVAEIAGIRVNKIRIIAIVLSIVLAALGQILWLQNMGVMNTYSSHEQVGFFAIAAILVGGATVSRARIANVIIGAILFHMLIGVVAVAGTKMNVPQIGEYLRSFFTWAVIAGALIIHAWRRGRASASAAAAAAAAVAVADADG